MCSYCNLSHGDDRLINGIRNSQSSYIEAQIGKIFPNPRHILAVKKYVAPNPVAIGSSARRSPMNAPAKFHDVTLEDKYTLDSGRVFLTGTQALVRLPMLQRERDVAAGLNTAGFISGYRGSPLGGLDQSLWKAKKHLAGNQVVFQPGVNEDLAATAVWGSQQVNLYPGAKFDGVFSMWYGKGPGVDRCG